MKINILCGQNLLSDFVNIDHRINLIKDIGENRFATAYYNNLDSVVEDNSCDTIVVSEVINIFNPQEVMNIFRHWTKKLKFNGKIVIRFYDIFNIAKCLSGKILTSDYANKVINGKGSFASVLDYGAMREVLRECGLNVVSTFHNEITEVEARKS